MAASRSIEVPLNDDQVLVVDIADIVDEAESIFSILRDERPQLKYFIEFALEYHKRGREDNFERILQEAVRGPQLDRRSPQHLLLVYNTLTCHHLHKASLATPETQGTYLKPAAELLNAASNEANSQKDLLTANVNGLYQLLHKDQQDAQHQFQFVLSQDPNNIVALLGQAAVKFNLGKFAEALLSYQRVLPLIPDGDPDVRVPIGLCLAKLNMIDEARHAFERALTRNERNVDALAALCVLDWNSYHEENEDEDGIRRFHRSFAERITAASELAPDHPMIALVLAEAFLARKHYQKAAISANMSLVKCQDPSVKADAELVLGKIDHAQNLYDDAFRHYRAAVEYNSQSTATQYYLGQMYAHKGGVSSAIECFEKVQSAHPTDYFTQQKLAILHSASQDSKSKGALYIKQLLKAHEKVEPADELVDLHLDNATMLEEGDRNSAIQSYQSAANLMEELGVSVPPELYNNIAAIMWSQGDYNGSMDNFKKALRIAESSKSQNARETTTTIQYNIGRIHEANGNSEEAKLVYEHIIKEHPTYMDAHLRLGEMQSAAGTHDEAIIHFRTAIAAQPEQIEPWILLASSYANQLPSHQNQAPHVHQGQKLARRTLQKALQEIDKHDVYALCQFGNINLKIARTDHSSQRATHFERAFQFFEKALRVDNQCHYAATGIAIVLAETGRYKEAKDIFSQVQESMGTPTAQVMVNLAHLQVELGNYQLEHGNQQYMLNYQNAITLYESALKKFFDNKDPYLLQCLARVHFILAKTGKDLQSLKKSMSCMQRAMRINPSDFTTLYNIALLEQQQAQLWNDQAIQNRKLNEMKHAAEGLEVAKNFFLFLAEQPQSAQMGYDGKYAKQRGEYSTNLRKQTDRKIHETETLTREREQRLKDIEEAQIKKQREKEAELARAQDEERRRREEAARSRELLLGRTTDLVKMFEEEEKPKRGRKAAVAGGDDMDVDTDPPKRRKKQSEQRKRKEVEEGGGGGGSESDDGGRGNKKRKRAKAVSAATIADSDDGE